MFPGKCFGFRLELVDEFTEIVPSAFIDRQQGLVACVKIIFQESFTVFITLKKWCKRQVGLNWNADGIERILNRKFSTEIEYYQEK